MIYKVNIEGYGDLPVTPTFAPKVTILKKPNGTVYSTRETWEFEGILPVDPIIGGQSLKDARDELIAIFLQQNASVYFTADGNVFESITPATHMNGAFFTNFDVQGSNGGEWVNHLVYRFTVYGDKPVAIAGILDVSTQIRIEDDNGKITTTYDISAKGPNAQLYVEGQKPGKTSRSTITVDIENQSARGTFTVTAADEGSGEGGDIDIEETVSVEPGIFEPRFISGTRTEEPSAFWTSKRPTRIRISGRVSILGKAPLVPPLSDRFSKYLSTAPRLSRGVEERAATGSDRREYLSYDLSIEVPFEISLDEVMEERRSIEVESFKRDEGEPGGVFISDAQTTGEEVPGLVIPERKQ